MYLPRCSRMPCHSEGWKCSSISAIRMPSQISSLALEVSTACDKVLRQRGPSLAHFPVSSLDSCHFQWLVILAACVVAFSRLLFFSLRFLAMELSPAQKSGVSLLINPKVEQNILKAGKMRFYFGWGFWGFWFDMHTCFMVCLFPAFILFWICNKRHMRK